MLGASPGTVVVVNEIVEDDVELLLIVELVDDAVDDVVDKVELLELVDDDVDVVVDDVVVGATGPYTSISVSRQFSPPDTWEIPKESQTIFTYLFVCDGDRLSSQYPVLSPVVFRVGASNVPTSVQLRLSSDTYTNPELYDDP